MLSLTKLLTSDAYLGDEYRYRSDSGSQLHGVAPGKGPVVVWNITHQCNLSCRHCYAEADFDRDRKELSTDEAHQVIDDLADFNVPVILMSGGEPLCRQDFFELVEHAKAKGIRVTLSTNGTLIDEDTAKKIKASGIGYVGISFDGMQAVNDAFRGVDGAFAQALQGVRNCRAVGQRTGLRFTINQNNYTEIPAVFDLLETEDIDRACFYHLVYSGRGSDIQNEDLSHAQTRAVMDQIIQRTLDLDARGKKKEILTVDNHTDGIYLYLKYKDSEPERAAYIKQMLSNNGGNRSGMAIACIDPVGNVHPDQFTWQYTFGNVRDRRFGDIWTNVQDPILSKFKNRKALLPDRCKSCQYLSMCNGNFRTRAEAATGDLWGFDPACYLTEEECSKNL